LLPIFRSQQQAEILALLLGEPDTERSLTDVVAKSGAPYASVHREIARAEACGLTTSRMVGRTRLVRANKDSPYFLGLADVLVRAFGAPSILGEALAAIDGIDRAYIYGSWAARFTGHEGVRTVGDIDLLVLGDPDRSAVYEAASLAEARLDRPVQVTIRPTRWLADGEGSFHDTVVSRPLVPLVLRPAETAVAGRTT
jgi:hypothetical protein